MLQHWYMRFYHIQGHKKIAPEGAIFLIHHSELEVNTTLEQLVAADEQREEPARSVYGDHVPKIHEAGLLYGLDRVRDRGVGVRHLNCEVASHDEPVR